MPSLPAPVERRLVLVISAVVFVDTMFYAVIAPLLPTLTQELHLSKLSAGVMTASYPVGTLLGSLPGGIVAARAGPRPTVMTGLALLAASTVAFAVLAHSTVCSRSERAAALRRIGRIGAAGYNPCAIGRGLRRAQCRVRLTLARSGGRSARRSPSSRQRR